jgi:hypothetical protein
MKNLYQLFHDTIWERIRKLYPNGTWMVTPGCIESVKMDILVELLEHQKSLDLSKEAISNFKKRERNKFDGGTLDGENSHPGMKRR